MPNKPECLTIELSGREAPAEVEGSMAARNTGTVKREKLRDSLFVGSGGLTYPRPREKGWFKCPRTMPILLELLGTKAFSGGKDLTRTYIGVMADNYGEGIIEVRDEAAFAQEAGFEGPRGVRSWRERMKALKVLGFVDLVLGASGRVNFVLIVDPRVAVDRLLETRGGDVSEDWKTRYRAKLILTRSTSEDVASIEEEEEEEAKATKAPGLKLQNAPDVETGRQQQGIE